MRKLFNGVSTIVLISLAAGGFWYKIGSDMFGDNESAFGSSGKQLYDERRHKREMEEAMNLKIEAAKRAYVK